MFKRKIKELKLEDEPRIEEYKPMKALSNKQLGDKIEELEKKVTELILWKEKMEVYLNLMAEKVKGWIKE